MQCPLEQRGNYWLCPRCGLLVPRHGDKPPRSTCSGQWRQRRPPPRRQLTRREAVLARYDAQQLTDPPKTELDRRLAVCESCPLYAGYACITLGSACRRPERWWERVLLASCDRLTVGG